MSDDEKKLPPEKQKIADKICLRISEGESLRKICLSEGMPHNSTVVGWKKIYADFAKQYAHAREDGADYMFDDIVDIADSSEADFKLVDGKIVVDGTHIQRDRVRIDTRKFKIARMMPRLYGDKLDLTVHTEAPPLTIVFNVNAPVGEIRVTKS